MILGTIKTQRRTSTSFLIECSTSIMKLSQTIIRGKSLMTIKVAANNEEEIQLRRIWVRKCIKDANLNFPNSAYDIMKNLYNVHNELVKEVILRTSTRQSEERNSCKVKHDWRTIRSIISTLRITSKGRYS